MNKIKFLAMISLMAALASCSSGNDSKMITPTSTEFPSGELAKYIEIADQPSELTFAETEGSMPTQYIRLKVTLKLVRDGLKDVDARDINFTGLLSVAVIKLVDENGSDIQDLDLKYEEILTLQKLLTGNVGDTAEITFEGEFHNHDDAPTWFKQATQFSPYLSGDIDTASAASDPLEAQEYPLGDDTSAEESSFNLGDVDTSSSSGSEDWDALLDSYEKYVDKYVSLVKKAAKGDMTALAEYPSLMEKAQEFSDKLQNAEGDMSASQWTRYNNISMKMMKAAQEMQQ